MEKVNPARFARDHEVCKNQCIYVYYEENSGSLINECGGILSDVEVFSDKEKAKQQVAGTLKEYCGISHDGSPAKDFCVDHDVLCDAEMIEDNEVGKCRLFGLTDEQIQTLVDYIFVDTEDYLTLYYREHENYDAYFTINVVEKELQ